MTAIAKNQNSTVPNRKERLKLFEWRHNTFQECDILHRSIQPYCTISSLVMTTFMPPPSAFTYLAFHPQDNNIIAIGMEDSTVRVDEVKTKLKGHQKRISGLAFSTNLGILVSSGVDPHLCVWSIDLYCRSQAVYPFVVAAHPLEPNQFALGLTDGSVKVIDRAQ
ncbi:hypothetical protein P8452_63455 [Trifolium repens]|nr:hypothetical protein P8452_63455 [Trifolium repens]